MIGCEGQGSCGYGVVAMGWQMSSERGENVDLAIFESSTIPTVL